MLTPSYYYRNARIEYPNIGLFILVSLLIIGCSPDAKDNDNGFNFGQLIQLASPANPQSSEPFLFSSIQGEVFCLWTEQKNDEVYELRFSPFVNGGWERSQSIAKGNDWFINWADFPAMATSTSGNMIAHFLSKSGKSTYAYNIDLVHSWDGGKNWSKPVTLHDDNTQTEHGFVSMLGLANGDFFLTWLDGRNTASSNEEVHEHGTGAMTIRATFLDPNGTKKEEKELDNRVCDCCQTGATITDNGPVVVYRNRSEDEIRDISIVRYEAGNWSSPQIVYSDNWKIAGCPVNGPKVDAINNSLAIAWFSAANNDPQVKLLFSDNEGKSFGDAFRIDHGNPLGRVDVLMLDEQTAFISWLESEQEAAQILAAIVNSEGKILQTYSISKTSQARASGFPQMVKSEEGIVFAWTQVDSFPVVKTAILPL